MVFSTIKVSVFLLFTLLGKYIDICCDNSKTYLMVFFNNLGINFMHRQTIE